MKKLKIANLSPTPLMYILAVGVIIAVPLRVFQLCNCIDSTTGFWAKQDFTVWVLYILLALIVLLSLFFSFFSGVMTKPKFKEEKDIILGIFAGIFSITMLIDAIVSVSNFISLMSTFTADNSGNLKDYLTTSGGLAMILEAVFGLLGTIYIVFISVSSITGNDKYSSKHFLALGPVLWAMFRLIYHFVDPVNYRNVSQLFLEIMMLCFAMIFFLSFARIASEINEDNSMSTLWFSGICTSLLAFVCALAPFILVITGKGSLIPSAYPMRYCDLGLALFTCSFLFTVTPLTNEVGED